MTNVLDGTRLTIADLLQKNGSATVESLASQLGLASATVRRHLDILQRDGIVVFQEVRRGTGRPKHSFRLSEVGQEALPKAYDRLLVLLLQEINRLKKGDLDHADGDQILSELFKRMAHNMAAAYVSPGSPLPDRIQALVQLMEEVGYSPEIRRQDGSTRLVVFNCPFRSVAREIGSTCLFDSTLISTILDIPVTKTDCITMGASACSYDLHT
jgi:predicted ArsR family transcriptional regulator